ncbi:dipeptide epimerase [Caulobacter sp. CCUG 60055]|uniref:N-acetyl-D-Glu racemase DgcA n=1 Tax=Caulobacter sp. CCUG 60055 TaxID=2100090 RepID=UPI001FA74037|nr:N-acetyl-D-Glu racemase DgcA [Caulobacter sp. CCUG 60055]MCI3179271.1 dipeptide epimerase [Caulobacter sp. CCUG 60055]
MRRLEARDERWPIAGAFTIARGSKTEAHVVVAELRCGDAVGRGECTPYPRYGETVEGVLGEIEAARGPLEAGCDRAALQDLLRPGAARNALDCALWDLEAKQSGVPAHVRAGRQRLDPVKTCYTISLAAPEVMAEQARAAARRPMLKLKIGGPGDLERVEAVRRAAPRTRLVVDANEALSFDDLVRLAPEFARLDVLLIEQPLKAGADEALEGFASPVPLCADESLHTRADLAAIARRYGCVNVKLDKTGGLTEALALVADARALGLEIMAGCMVATSLAMAPAMILAQGARVVDLDGPLLLARDREPGLIFHGSMIEPPSPALWG